MFLELIKLSIRFCVDKGFENLEMPKHYHISAANRNINNLICKRIGMISDNECYKLNQGHAENIVSTKYEY
jgi:hypothetical protein